MKKRVFIVHGWDGYPEEGWFPWLKKELEARGFEVHVPALPDAKTPRIGTWVPALAEAVCTPDADTYFVGHSIGCQTIARYLASLPQGVTIGGAVFVGGFFKRLAGIGFIAEFFKRLIGIGEEGGGAAAIVREWLTTPLDLGKVKSHLPKSVAIFSDNDYYVPLDNQDDFRDKLGSEIVVVPKRGHFSGGDGVTELPEARDAVLGMAR